MANIKPMNRISKKWNDRASVSQDSYAEGVQNPRADWAVQTAAAEQNYNKGVQAAIGRGAFGKGVKAVGVQGWQQAAIAKGPSRWAEGVRLSQNKFERAFAPYRDVIEKTVLPTRGPKGDPANINRVAVLSKALHDEKLRRMGT